MGLRYKDTVWVRVGVEPWRPGGIPLLPEGARLDDWISIMHHSPSPSPSPSPRRPQYCLAPAQRAMGKEPMYVTKMTSPSEGPITWVLLSGIIHTLTEWRVDDAMLAI